MNSKRNSENTEEQDRQVEPPSTPERVAVESVISAGGGQNDFRSASEISHANDQTPSQLDLPAEGNNFHLTGDFQAGDGKTINSLSPQTKIRSVSPAELEAKANGGDEFAAFFVKERGSILENFADSPEREKQLSQLQTNADKMFGVRVQGDAVVSQTLANNLTPEKNAPFSTQELTALSDSHPLAAAGSEMLAATSDPSARASIKQDITNLMSDEQKTVGELPGRVVLQSEKVVRLEINAVQNVFVPDAPAVVNDFDSAMSALSKLPVQQQLEVLGKGLQTFNQSIEEQQKEISIGATIGVVQGVGNTLIGIVNFAQFVGDGVVFASDLATNNPRYLETADKVGDAIGKTLVTGYRLFEVAKEYSAQVDAGDRKPLDDINLVAAELDKQWQQLPPRERARMSSEFLTEFGASLVPLTGAAKLMESQKLVSTLEEMGSGVSKLDSATKRNYLQGVKNLIDELLTGKKNSKGACATQELLVDSENSLKRSDIGDGPQKPFSDEEFESHLKRLPDKASEAFRKNLDQEVEKLEPFEKELLSELNGGPSGDHIGVPAIAKDRGKQDLLTTLGYFKELEKRLHVGEKVWQSNDWQDVRDVAHTLRHELGHAFNARRMKAGDLLSNSQDFTRICNKILGEMSEDEKYTLFSRFVRRDNSGNLLQNKFGKISYDLQLVRDEIFAETYAHFQLGKNDLSYIYNQRMGHYFKSATTDYFHSLLKEHRR